MAKTGIVGGLFLLALLTQPLTAGARCSIVGTSDGDSLTGTGHRDIICARAGPDSVDGSNGRDKILGGPGNDVLNGGDDTRRDLILGGTGSDLCVKRPKDRLRACEAVLKRGPIGE